MDLEFIKKRLPSKIYLIAYPEPLSGYAIAQKIYGKKKGEIPPVGRIYPYLHKLEATGAIIHGEKGFMSTPKPLLQAIESRLQEQRLETNVLNKEERNALVKILDSEVFRKFIGHRIRNLNFKQDINGIDSLLADLAWFYAVYGIFLPPELDDYKRRELYMKKIEQNPWLVELLNAKELKPLLDFSNPILKDAPSSLYATIASLNVFAQLFIAMYDAICEALLIEKKEEEERKEFEEMEKEYEEMKKEFLNSQS